MTSADEIEVRRATIGDADAIRTLHLALCAELYPGSTTQWILSAEGSSYLARRLAGEGVALVAVLRGQTTGYLMGGSRVSSDGQSAAGLESMYVVPDSRRKQVGMTLVDCFVRWFAASGFERASVAVQPENAAAHRLYLKAGFTDQALIENGRTVVLTMARLGGEG